MKYAREFMLPLAGLPLGETVYTFDLAHPFFVLNEDEEVTDAMVRAILMLNKHENMIELHFKVEGWIELPCDRCADLYRQEITGEQQLILKYGETYEEETDEIIVIPPDLHEFDIHHLLYEYIILMLPYRRVHLEDEEGNSGCNPEVLRHLEQMQSETVIDPRWEALKKLNNLS